MKPINLFVILIVGVQSLMAQTYFPPALGTWETVSPASLGWCTDKLDSVTAFAGSKNSKAFIILHHGKIASENYYGSFTQDSIWYWASAAKSFIAFLTGQAQEEGLLDIDDKTSDYLGVGWTNCTTVQEDMITIKNQLSMTSGLDDDVPNDDCTDDSCLIYKADAGTRWAYHNAPYTLMQDVIENASGVSLNAFAYAHVCTPIGMGGLFLPYDTYSKTYFSKARDMARFGLLVQNNGIWNGDTLLHDQTYFQEMTNTSNSLNLSYGYLWWLNGKGSCMIPETQFVFAQDLIPHAPDDMICALGKNDQKIYVVPSIDLVVIRMGDAADTLALSLSTFDDVLWEKLMQVFCTSSIAENENAEVSVYPNPFSDFIAVENGQENYILSLSDATGRQILSGKNALNTGKLQNGFYLLEMRNSKNEIVRKQLMIK